MSLISERIGHWQAEGEQSALRIDPVLLAAPGARDRLVRCVLAQRDRPVAGLAPVVDLVARDDATGTAVWLVVAGPATPTLDPATVTAADARRTLAVGAETLAALHAAGAVHGDFGAHALVAGAQPRVLEAGLRAALTDRAGSATHDVAAWVALADDVAQALAGRDQAAAQAIARAAHAGRAQGLLAAAAMLRGDAADPQRTLLAKPGLAVPPPPPAAKPAPGVTLLGARRSSGEQVAGLARFGPGVPAAAGPVDAMWRADAPRRRRPRRRRSLLSALGTLLFVAAVVVAYLWWRGRLTDVHVDAVSVAVAPVAGCNATVDVVGHIATNGEAGVVRYHWLRNDGTDSGIFEQHVHPGQHDVTVHLRWTLRGGGTFNAAATLRLTSPQALQATGRFRYVCRE